MLQQRVVLVADATETRRRWAAQQANVEAQSKRKAALEEQDQALVQRNERLVGERRVLKKAYTNLVQHSTVSLGRYVEQGAWTSWQQRGTIFIRKIVFLSR